MQNATASAAIEEIDVTRTPEEEDYREGELSFLVRNEQGLLREAIFSTVQNEGFSCNTYTRQEDVFSCRSNFLVLEGDLPKNLIVQVSVWVFFIQSQPPDSFYFKIRFLVAETRRLSRRYRRSANPVVLKEAQAFARELGNAIQFQVSSEPGGAPEG